MASYRIRFLKSVEKALSKLPKKIQRLVAESIEALRSNPYPEGHKILKGQREEIVRVRSGSYRILYRVNGEEIVVLVVRIAH